MTATPRVSFEFFPPQSLEGSFRLWDAARTLAPLAPSFVSVTYGAGGTTRDLTHEAVTTLGREFGVTVAAHLTCVEASRAETLAIARRYLAAGVRQIVALRGDPPKGTARFTPHPEGYADTVALIEGLRSLGDLTIRVGAYPEPHPDAADAGADVRWLKRKFDAGADSAITQFFFRAETFLRFRDACAAAGLDGDRIIPGILPIQSWDGAKRFAARCGAQVPPALDAAFRKAARDGRESLLATAHCTELCDRLRREGVRDLHFYTLNRPQLTRDVCHALGLTAAVPLQQVA